MSYLWLKTHEICETTSSKNKRHVVIMKILCYAKYEELFVSYHGKVINNISIFLGRFYSGNCKHPRTLIRDAKNNCIILIRNISGQR